MAKRTQEEIDRQIAGLKKERASLPERTAFNDPNWKGIDAQIAVLEGKKDADYYKPVTGDVNDEEEDESFDGETFESDEAIDQKYEYERAQEAEDWLWNMRNEDLFDNS